ncbi:MAG: hypothetical protein FJW40_17025 [Acidobacteria bacterium]|nr:hypothetical protein [Acidobacteriota bacterium]
MFNRPLLVAATLSTAALALLSTGCTQLRARDNLNKGVQAFKNAKYSEAVDHFKIAVELDPTFTPARLYLATAYMTQYIPGAESPENKQNAQAAEDNFLEVLKIEANNKLAIQSLASLKYNQASGIPALEDKLKKLDESRDWYVKLIQVDPSEKVGYYSLGVITWLKWYPKLMEARNKLHMKQEDPGPLKDKKLREDLKANYETLVNEGIGHLKKALEIDKEYDDAMAYMNLLVRERADLLDNKEAYDKDIKEADEWVQKALETKKMKAARMPGNTGITQDEPAK